MTVNHASLDPDLQQRIESLTRREREVLALVGEGYSLPAIAQRLYRSLKTIESHRLSLGRKLRVSNRVELARIAIQMGLAPLPGHEATAAERSSAVRERVKARGKAWDVLRAVDAHVSTADAPEAVLAAIVEALQTQLSAELVALVHCETGSPCEVVASATRNRSPMPPSFAHDDALIGDIRDEGYIAMEPLPEPYRDHPLVVDRGVRAIHGIRLEDHAGHPTGALIVLVDWPAAEDFEIELLLRAMASRAAAELDDLQHLRNARELARAATPEDHRAGQGPRLDHPAFEALASKLHDGLAAIDASFRLVYVNPVLSGWIRRSAEELIGRDVSAIQTHEHANWFREVQPLRESGKLKRYRLDLLDHQQRPIPTIAYPATIYDAAGHYVGGFGLLVRL